MSTALVTAAVADLLTIAPASEEPQAEGRESACVQALVDAARAGDREAFGALIALHERAVLRTAVAALGCREDAEDAAQDALVVAWQKLGGFRGDASFKTWLLTIVWHKALDRRRRRRTLWSRIASPRREDETTGRLIEHLETEMPDPERTTMSRDLLRRVHGKIQQLSPKLRDTLVLAASGDHSYDEVASMLGVPLGTVKWRVAEARRLVIERMNGGQESER